VNSASLEEKKHKTMKILSAILVAVTLHSQLATADNWVSSPHFYKM
jgi:hypothetical protein